MKKRMHGFTLLELMVVLVLVGILLGIGVPSMGNFIRNSRMTSSANDLIAALHLARSEAIKRRVSVTACASANPLAADEDDVACVTTGTASRQLNSANGWIVFVDGNGDGVRDAGEELLQQRGPLPAEIVARGSETPLRVTYLDTGFTGTFTDLDGDGKRDVVADLDVNEDGVFDLAEDIDGDGNQDIVEPLVRGTALNIVFCDARGNVASWGELSAARGISIAATGRPQVTRARTEIAALLTDNDGGAIAGCT